MKKRAVFFIAAILLSAFAGGVEVVVFDTAEQETRYRQLTKELRCLVCQNQTLDESGAELAADMRAVVAAMVRDNAANEDIISFMSLRYGDFVHYRPPLRLDTLALWGAPFLLAVLAAALLPLIARRRVAPLDKEARRRAENLLKEESTKVD